MLPKIIDLSLISKNQIRQLIAKLEEITLGCDQVELPIFHHFSKGVYARELHIPKGIFIIGKIHKFRNLNVLSKGECSVLSIDGVMRLKAPHTMVSSPLVKRAIYAHEDCVWTTIHGTDETDLEKIEEEVILKTYEEA